MVELYSYKGLIVWQKSMDLVTEIYKITDNFPKSEIYSLTSQIRRCAVSIPSNIAEGRYRGSKKEFTHFVKIAYGSGAELETQIEIAKRLKFVENKDYKIADKLLLEVMKMLNIFSKKLKAKNLKT